MRSCVADAVTTDASGFERIANFRDFGGVATADGSRVLPGRLFRAAHPAHATDADLQHLAALDVTLVVDLRRPGERREEPSRIRPGPRTTVLSNDLGADIEAPHVAFLRRGDSSDAAVEGFLLDYYEHAADEPRHRALFAATFTALERLQGGLLVHCAAGKDRTGLLVALIQGVLGVPEAAIMAEYLRTNAAMLTPARIAATRTRLQTQLGRAPSDAVVRALLGVCEAHLAQALRAIAARHGSIEAYLDGLGVDTEARSRIRARFTAPGT